MSTGNERVKHFTTVLKNFEDQITLTDVIRHTWHAAWYEWHLYKEETHDRRKRTHGTWLNNIEDVYEFRKELQDL